MRIVWAFIVIALVLGVAVNNTFTSMPGSALSAAQMSQLYDGASATFLALIAITLALWYAGTRKQ